MKKKIAVIGAGAMGLAVAYHLLEAGHEVAVYESGSIPGGMAAHFDFDGLSIERFYHFVCKSDHALFELMDELEIGDAMRWRETSMGFYFQGAMHRWGDPIALLRFPGLGLLGKLRYGLHAFTSTRRRNWSKLDAQRADIWLRKWIGDEAFEVCWAKLFELKFFHYQHDISAAWIWTRIKRVGTSRKSLMREELGYIEGGSETLISRLVDRIEELGGNVALSSPVERITIDGDKVSGLVLRGEHHAYDVVISTVAIPYAASMLGDLPSDLRARYEALPNIGVVCVVHKLRKPISGHFWVNINDARFEVPGIVEFSNLRPTGDTIVYIPYYMPQDHPKFAWTDDQFRVETTRYLKILNPSMTDDDFLGFKVGRLRYAQPVCEPGFLGRIPPISPGIDGLMIADTSFYYPEDRGISESVRLAKGMAMAIGAAHPRERRATRE
jgi:protoporphyrinogen oxidase